MTITGLLKHEMEAPEGVSFSLSDGTLTVSGPKGSLSREFVHPRVFVDIVDGHVEVTSEMPRTKEKALAGTFASHIRNMVTGVTNGYEYRMKVVYSHFPMKVAVKGDFVVIDNYMGGRATRKAKIVRDTKVQVKGADVTVSGIDLEAVGQTAANINKATSRTGFDVRVFQDGIYVVERIGKVKQ